MFLRWKFEHSKADGQHCWEYRRWFGYGRSIATVWANGVWHTWDKDGCGGENGKESSIAKAQFIAGNCAIRQGFG